MSDDSKKEKNDGKPVNPERSPAEETESPGTSEASSDACEGTSSDSNPSRDFESSSNLSSHEPVVKPNGFSLADIRLSQDFDGMAGVKKVIMTVRVDKPQRDIFFRVHPQGDWRVTALVLELTEDHEVYVVLPSVHHYVGDLAVPTVLHTGITRNGDLFLLPVKLPGAGGKSNPWNESRLAAAELAKWKWIRMVPNMGIGSYDVYAAVGNIPDPEWPTDMTFEGLLNIAFKDRIIDSPDHPVLKKLRGEI